MLVNIQMLRAVAALLVFLHHLKPHYLASGDLSQSLISVAERGGFGVDVFFVISGFVIAYTTLPGPRDGGALAKFAQRRLARIYMGYWPMLALAVLLMWLYPGQRLQSISLVDSVLLISPDPHQNVLPVAWSLSYELYFYFMYALVFCCENKTIKNCFVIAGLGVLCYALLAHPRRADILSFWLSPLLLEFFAGFFIYYYRSYLTRKSLILPAFFVAIMMFWAGTTHPGLVNRALYFGSSAAAIVIISLQLESAKLFRAPGWLVKLGDSSYTLYLTHLLFIRLFNHLGCRDWLSSQAQWVTELGYLVFIVAVLLLSHFIFLKVERPLYRRVCQIKLFKP